MGFWIIAALSFVLHPFMVAAVIRVDQFYMHKQAVKLNPRAEVPATPSYWTLMRGSKALPENGYYTWVGLGRWSIYYEE